MSFLLNTNVISEWVRQRPDPGVVSWLEKVDETAVFLSVVSFAEIRHGIERLPAGARRERLASWLAEDLARRFEGRILAVDRRVAESWGVLMARAARSGGSLGAMDAFFAATADAHGLTLVTRNVKDFAALEMDLFDPWSRP